MEGRGGSFSSPRTYAVALLETPRRLVQRMGAVSSCKEELTGVKARSGAEMQRSLRWYDLVALGIGGMVGAGVFVTTGNAARNLAGPSIILSYLIAGVSALLSALCYTEFAVAMPVAGGAFSYLRTTFGEFPAYITGANLLMEYVVSNAAVARSFTSYLGSAIGFQDVNKWRFKVQGLPEGFNELDHIAVALIFVLTICICYSTKESSAVNMVLTALHLGFILFIIVIGFTKGHVKNLTEPANPAKPGGFAPYGVNGVFNAAARVYFCYLGYDTVSTMAEEVKNHATDIPIGVSGSVIIVTVLYCLMATAMCTLVPYDMINIDAPFSMAFNNDPGWEWASNIVGVGASLGILASLLVAMLGQARYMCVIGRSHVIPHWFAKVNSRTSTPVNASIFLGICTAAIGLFTELTILVELTSIGTFFVFYMVANALIYRRYVVVGENTSPWPTLAFLSVLSWIAIVFASLWQFQGGRGNSWCLAICGLGAVVLTYFFSALVPQAKQQPREWGVPCMPWIAAASIFLNVFLMGSLSKGSYTRFAIFSIVAIVFYLVYGVHATYDAECRAASSALGPPAALEVYFIASSTVPESKTAQIAQKKEFS